MPIKQLFAGFSLSILSAMAVACESVGQRSDALVPAPETTSYSASYFSVSSEPQALPSVERPAVIELAQADSSAPKVARASVTANDSAKGSTAEATQAIENAAASPEAKTPVKALQDYLAKTQSLSANFVQRVRDEEGELLQESRGSVALARPNKLHWSTTEPYDYLVVTDGKTLWRYDAGLEQLDSEPLADDFTQTPALLLAGDTTALEAAYIVRRESNGFDEIFTLTPRNEDSPWRQLTLSYSHQKLVGMDMIDSLNQSTHIYLGSVVLNGPVDEAKFQFDAQTKAQGSEGA